MQINESLRNPAGVIMLDADLSPPSAKGAATLLVVEGQSADVWFTCWGQWRNVDAASIMVLCRE
jgi:hypothetical protein